MDYSNTCTCAQDVAHSYLTHHGAHTPRTSGTLYQTSLMSALIAGVYDGETTIAQLQDIGDFGLGTFNQLDGELIMFDRDPHQLRDDGSARQATPDQKTPFAVVTDFQPSITMDLPDALDKAQIQAIVDNLAQSPNVFCALRIDGEFEIVHTRTVPRQEPPYKPMLEAIADQPIYHFDNVSGTMVGFRCPDFVQGINVAGYHIHFITDDRLGGGHVLDYRLRHGRLQLGFLSQLRIEVPQTGEFLNTDLMPEDLHKAIEMAEG